MDARITKKRLGVMLSYDWIKIIALAAAVILFWTFMFSWTATKLTAAQEFTIFSYRGTYVGEAFTTSSAKLKKEGVFSYDIQKVSAQDITLGGSEMEQVMEARLSTGEGDVAFVPDTLEGVSETLKFKAEDGTEYTPTYLEQFVNRYVSSIAELADETKGLLARTKAYLDPLYGGNATADAVMDEAAVEKEFRARIKRLKDKRFKKQSEIKAGLEQEKARVRMIFENYHEFTGYLADGTVEFVHVDVCLWDMDGNAHTRSGKYAINISPNKDSRVRELAYYYRKDVETDELGVEHEHDVPTSENMTLVVLDVFRGDYAKYGYGIFETLSYVNYIVRNYTMQDYK